MIIYTANDIHVNALYNYNYFISNSDDPNKYKELFNLLAFNSWHINSLVESQKKLMNLLMEKCKDSINEGGKE